MATKTQIPTGLDGAQQAEPLIIRERRRVEGAMGDEWDGDLSRDIDLLLVVEDMRAEYLSEGRRHGRS